jgi:hypothetical protein
MSFETAGGAAAIKFFGAAVVAAAVGTALGYVLMWPRTAREAACRFACSFACSFIFGPLLFMAAHSWWPGLFASAREFGQQYTGEPLVGLLMAAAPFLVIAALPAWWILGALVLWLERRRGKDLGEIMHDAAEVVRDVRGAL